MTLKFVEAINANERAKVVAIRQKWARALTLHGKMPKTPQEAKELRELVAYFTINDEEDL